MHRIAEEGIAAHWLYKEQTERPATSSTTPSRGSGSSLESQKEVKDPQGVPRHRPARPLPRRGLRLHAQGRRQGAARRAPRPIDFAYAVHTDVGHHCVGAKVNGKLVPLRYTLRQGDIVEVVASPSQHPSRDWLKIVKSNRARAKINQWLKVEERARSLELGRELFEREAKKYRLSPPTLLGADEMKKLIAELGLPVRGRPAGLHRLRQDLGAAGAGQARPGRRPRAEQAPDDRQKAPRKTDGAVRIRGVDDLLVRFGKCCSPVPGDGIVGFITRGRGLTVHARDCLTVAKNVLDKERLVAVGVGRRRAGQAAGAASRSTSGATVRASSPRSPPPSRPGTATSPRPRSPSPTTARASTTSWSRWTTSSSCRTSCRPSARSRTSSTSSACGGV